MKKRLLLICFVVLSVSASRLPPRHRHTYVTGGISIGAPLIPLIGPLPDYLILDPNQPAFPTDSLVGDTVVIVNGTDAGMVATITESAGDSIRFVPPFPVPVDGTSQYAILWIQEK